MARDDRATSTCSYAYANGVVCSFGIVVVGERVCRQLVDGVVDRGSSGAVQPKSLDYASCTPIGAEQLFELDI